jgi:hypothetical protein
VANDLAFETHHLTRNESVCRRFARWRLEVGGKRLSFAERTSRIIPAGCIRQVPVLHYSVMDLFTYLPAAPACSFHLCRVNLLPLYPYEISYRYVCFRLFVLVIDLAAFLSIVRLRLRVPPRRAGLSTSTTEQVIGLRPRRTAQMPSSIADSAPEQIYCVLHRRPLDRKNIHDYHST